MVLKRVDFEVEGWGEAVRGLEGEGYALRPWSFRAGGVRPEVFRPGVGAGGALLSQEVGAGLVDRPVGGGVGVRVDVGGGEDGGFVSYDRGAVLGVTHARVMLRGVSWSGGSVVLMRGLDGAGVETFRCVYDGVGVTLVLGTAETVAVSLVGGIEWVCVEVGVDAVGGVAKVWVNGVEGGSVTGAFGGLGTRWVRVGVMLKDAGAVGVFYLDEFAVGDGYVGPVVVGPAGVYGDDPARWLVVYNSSDADSVGWAERYRVARGVPFANLAGFELSGDEVIGASAYLAMRDLIAGYLVDNGLAGQVVGVLLGYGVPGYVDLSGTGVLDSIAALLFDVGTTPKLNPLAVDGVADRPSVDNLQGLKLTARVDGVVVGDADALVSRATELKDQGLGDGAGSKVWLDPYTMSGPGTDGQIASMVGWAGSLDRMRTRLPLEVTAEAGGGVDPEFGSIHDDGFFWGWAQGAAPGGFFGAPGGSRVFCVQLDPASVTGGGLRSGGVGNWVEAALGAGYAAAVGSSRAYSGSAVPYVRPFFEGLRAGWCLGEAWFVANVVPGEGLELVGDPLLKVGFPQGGWDVFGGVGRLEELDMGAPLASLREGEVSHGLAVMDRPVDGGVLTYLVRRVDGLGRSEAGVCALRVANVVGVGVEAPLMPVWPGEAGWGVLVEGGRLRLRAVWERSLLGAGIERIELLGDEDGGGVMVLESVAVSAGARVVEVERDLPGVSGRYAWRVHGVGGVVLDTLWSGDVVRRVVGGFGLTVLGGG